MKTSTADTKDIVFLAETAKLAECFCEGISVPKSMAVQCLGFQEILNRDTLPEGSIVLLYPQCLRSLETAMRTGSEPDQALLRWIEWAEFCVHLLRKDRSRCIAFCAETALFDLRLARREIGKCFDIRFRAAVIDVEWQWGPRDSLLGYLAQQAYLGSAVARRLQAELEASSRLTVRGPDRVSLNDAYHTFMLQSAAEEVEREALKETVMLDDGETFQMLRNEMRETMTENRVLKQKVAALSDDRFLESETNAALQRDMARLQQQVSSGQATWAEEKRKQQTNLGCLSHKMKQKVQEAVTEKSVLQSELSQALKREKRLQNKLRHLQAELESNLCDLVMAEQTLFERTAALEEANHLIADRTGEVEALRSSTSWKVTGPLRGLRRAISPGEFS